MIRAAALLWLGAVLFVAAPLDAQTAPPLAVYPAEGGAELPRVVVGSVLADEALEDAVRSGLPLRMRLRVELWRDGFFDRLVQQASATGIVAYEPLARRFMAGLADADSLPRFGSFAAARAALEGTYHPEIRPTRPGRYYYIAFLQIETLSLSDLDELENWLRGELEPAVRGRRSVTGALGTGVKRILIRVLDLPARRYEARSERFRVP